MRSRARWRELLGVLGGLVDLGHLGVLDQVIDGLGATDGLADGRHAAIGDELSLGSLDVLDAGLLELGVDVVLGDLNLELTGESVERQGLTGNVVGLLVQVADELLHGQAGSGQPGVQRHAAGSEVGQEVLAKLLKDGLLVVGIHLVELQALGESGDATVLLLGREAGSLVLLDLDLNGVAHSVDAVEAKVGLDELVGELGGVADLNALDGDLDGVGLGLLALLDLVGPGDGLDVLDMAGNVGTQSLAVTIRVLMDESLTGKQKAELVWKEMTIGFSNGLILGTLSFIVIGLYIALFKGKTFMFAYAVSGCIGIALVVAMVISGAVGTCIPLFFKKINVDPAVASGPLITTINDLVAVVTYYGLSWIFLIEMLHLAG